MIELYIYSHLYIIFGERTDCQQKIGPTLWKFTDPSSKYLGWRSPMTFRFIRWVEGTNQIIWVCLKIWGIPPFMVMLWSFYGHVPYGRSGLCRSDPLRVWGPPEGPRCAWRCLNLCTPKLYGNVMHVTILVKYVKSMVSGCFWRFLHLTPSMFGAVWDL